MTPNNFKGQIRCLKLSGDTEDSCQAKGSQSSPVQGQKCHTIQRENPDEKVCGAQVNRRARGRGGHQSCTENS